MSNLQRKTNACYGIECWLRGQGLKVTTKTVSDITTEFLKYKGLPYTKFNPRYKGLFNAGICNAQSIQEHFSEFKKYVIDKNNMNIEDTNIRFMTKQEILDEYGDVLTDSEKEVIKNICTHEK